MKNEKLLEMARKAGAQDFAGGTCVVSISQLSDFANAILELAAQECDKAKQGIWEFHDPVVKETGENVCNNLANRIRELKGNN